MTDDTPPSFLGGGLPKRGEQTPSSDRAPGPRKRWWVIGGVATAAAALLATGIIAIPAMLEPAHPIASQTYEPFTPEEQVAADEAVAGGGGAIPGHIVSGELCGAVSAYMETGDETGSSVGVSDASLAAIDALAAIESPSQSAYQQYAALARDPESVTAMDEAQRIASDFATAIQVDVTTCL